jgi:Type II secretion system protein C
MKLAALRPKIRFEKKWPDIVAGILHAAVFILGGMLLARWVWLLFSPTVLVVPPALEQAVSSQSATILSGHWFGQNTGQTVVAAPATVNFKLVGVYAPTGSKLGFAIFKMADGKQKSVLLHQEITAGISLQLIKKNTVQVGQAGSTQTLELESRKQQNATPSAPTGLRL